MARCVAAGTTLEGGGVGLVRVCEAGAPLLGKGMTRGVQGAKITHSNEREGAARVDCDVKGPAE